jgi:predicted DNA-binding protein (MmcQ/YjbR family)
MNLQRIREVCLSFPGATEQIQWGKDLVFKIGGKMFLVACTEPVAPPKVAMSFKCDDETFAELVEKDGVTPAPYMAQHKWVALQQFDTLDMNQLQPLIARAFEIVSSKLPRKKPANPSARAKKAKRPPSRSLKAGNATAKKAKKSARKSKSARPRARRAAPARARRAR